MRSSHDALIARARSLAESTSALARALREEFGERRRLRFTSGLQLLASMASAQSATAAALRSAETLSELLSRQPEERSLERALADTVDCIDYLHTCATITSMHFAKIVRTIGNPEA